MSEIKCPYCDCIFSRNDLNSHLKAFGLKAGSHRREFKRVHNAVEHDLRRLHGGADRVVRAFRWIIKEDMMQIYV
jgi:uncharacterized C2H2 Zn-finger protein